MKKLCIIDDAFEEGLQRLGIRGEQETYTRDFFEQPRCGKLTQQAEDLISQGSDHGMDITICTTYNRQGTNSFLDVLATEENDAYIVDGNFPVFFNRTYEEIFARGSALARNAEARTEEVISAFRGRSVEGMDLVDFWEMDRCNYEIRMDFPPKGSLLANLARQAKEFCIAPEQIARLAAAAERGEDVGIDFTLSRYAGAIALAELSSRKRNYTLFTVDPVHGRWSVSLSLFNDLVDIDACQNNYECIASWIVRGRTADKIALDAQEITPGAIVFGSDYKRSLYSNVIERVGETF